MRYLFPFLLLFTTSLTAQQYFTVQGCTAETGLGLVKYTVGSVQRVDISELCVDRANGTIVSSESVSGLQLVKQNGTSEDYENLGLEVNAQMRPLMQIAPVIHQTYHGGVVDDGSPEFFFINRGGPQAQQSATQDFQISGYLYGPLAGPQVVAGKKFTSIIGVEIYRGKNTQVSGVDLNMFSGLLFEGDFSFTNGQAQAALTGYPDEALGMKNGRGSYSLAVDATGKVSATGTLYAQNSRTAGHTATEWISANLTSPYLIGHAVGATGQVIKAYGVAQGEVVNASGQRLPVVATVKFVAYDKALFP